MPTIPKDTKTPKQRSLEHLKHTGWHVADVERWIPHTKRTVDAFGFGDLLACRCVELSWPDKVPETGDIKLCEIALVQSTVASELSRRRKKIESSLEARFWFGCGGRIILHGWKAPTVKRPYWDLVEERVEF